MLFRSPTLKNLIFKNNSSRYIYGGGLYGGGIIYFYSSDAKLTNALFINNYGGAVLSHGISFIEITNATFSGNYNPGSGGAIQLWDASIILYNCIIWGNTAGSNGNEIHRAGDYNSIGLFNCCYKNEADDVYGSIYTENCITSDPKFVDPDNDDFTLYGISPCVNTGNNDYVASPYLVANTDLRGEARIQNTTIDMGCYEWTSGTDPTIPSVTTTAISSITHNSAQSGGNVTNDGEASVTARGVCWATTNPPDTDDNTTSNGTGEGVFISSLTGLSPQTQDYVRSYATNTAGTGYGNTLDFWTFSNEPTIQVSNFNSTVISTSRIDLSWTAATYPASGATTKAYVLLRATSPNNPVFASIDGQIPAAGANTIIVSPNI